jgi:uncharacterized protein (DUF1800 family)
MRSILPGSLLGILVASFGVVASAQAPQSPVTYQAGNPAATDTLCRSIQLAINGVPASAANVEGPELTLHPTGSVALVDFPHIIGTGLNQIPPGATIVSASLQLWCTNLESPQTTTRTVRVTPIIDLSAHGTWFNPAASGTLNGVNWVRRDARAFANTGWTPTVDSTLLASVAGPPSNQFVTNAYPDAQNIVTIGGGGPNQVSTWHSYNVTRAVSFWANGISNQGVMLERQTSTGGQLLVRYASDSASDPTKRPRLVVTFTVPPSPQPWNRVPRLLAPQPAAAVTQAGEDVFLTLGAVDDDGTTPSFCVLKKPSGGVLLGAFPYVTYRPDPGFTGTDDFSYAAYDSLAVCWPQTVTITVNGTAGTQNLVFQDGVSPSSDLAAATTKASTVNTDPLGNNQTFEDTYFNCNGGTYQSYLSFRNVIGSGAARIPPGSRILSARLELKSQYVSPPSIAGLERRVILTRVVDPLNRGASFDWYEPPTLSPPGQPCTSCGVSFLYPDARPPLGQSWAFAMGTSTAQRKALRGDLHPSDAASFRIYAAEALQNVTRTADVTASVQAWADGATNLGWLLESSDPTHLHFWSDNAPVAANRPRLLVTFRAPGAGQAPGATPHADAGSDQTVFAGQRVQLDGRCSFHPNGTGLTVGWLQTGGPPVVLNGALTMTPWFTAPTLPAGARTTLEFLFGGSDGTTWSTDAVKVEVVAQPGGGAIPSPIVNAGADVTVPELGVVNLSSTATGGTGTGNLHALWSQLSGPQIALSSRTAVAPSFTAPAVPSGTAVIVLDLAITDAGVPSGMSSVVHDQITITVQNLANNLPPVVSPGPNRTVESGEWVTLDGAGTYDPESQPITYTWVQQSPTNPAAIGPGNPFGNYVVQGTPSAISMPFKAPVVSSQTSFVFRLDVSDGEAVGSANVTITVTPTLPAFVGTVSLAPYREELTKEEARHLLRRIGAGWHPADVAQARSMMLSGTIATALGAVAQGQIMTEFLQYGVKLSSPGNPNPPVRQTFDPWPQYDDRQVEAWWLLHQFRTLGPFRERMLHFWNDRLAASPRNLIDSRRHWCLMHATMLRYGSLTQSQQTAQGVSQGCLGNFRDLLYDFAIDPVTLSFIEGFNNVAQAPNENFAREFMELHTLGIRDPVTNALNYTQTDVSEGARAWTGYREVAMGTSNWSYYPQWTPSLHDNGSKTILGQTGNWGPANMTSIVLGYQGGVPASRFLAKGLLTHFVMATPPPGLIDEFSGVIRAANWSMPTIMSALLRSNAMFSPGARKSIVKNPVELANGLVRTLRIPLQTQNIVGGAGASIFDQLIFAHHTLSDPPDVAGFDKDVALLDGYAMLQRSQIVRYLLMTASSPTSPSAVMTYQPPTGPPVTYPQYPYTVTGSFPYFAAVPVDPKSFLLPPPKARRSAETLDMMTELLDVELKTTPGSGGVSERTRALEYLDTYGQYAGPPPIPPTYVPQPFDGDSTSAEQTEKIWGLMMLLLEHPDFSRM